MRILICSDGTDPADHPARLGGLLAGPCQAETTLLGIIETADNEEPLRKALQAEAEMLRGLGVAPEIVVRTGDPIRQILEQTSGSEYDLVVIGARRTEGTGSYRRSEKTYEVIKAIKPPVLVAIESRSLRKFLVCTGGKHYIEDAVQLTGRVAAATGATVTLLHVMAEPPAIYADLMRMEEDVESLLASSSELGRNLRAQQRSLEKLGVPVEVRVRHGIVLDEIFREVNSGRHDLIVTGSSQARGVLRHYILGDLARSILNRATCPVLVARAGKLSESGGTFWGIFKRAFGPSRSHSAPPLRAE
jgi:nucleotide-binding universal stress UspA family protein